jgi:hypothetical protein
MEKQAAQRVDDEHKVIAIGCRGGSGVVDQDRDGEGSPLRAPRSPFKSRGWSANAPATPPAAVRYSADDEVRGEFDALGAQHLPHRDSKDRGHSGNTEFLDRLMDGGQRRRGRWCEDGVVEPDHAQFARYGDTEPARSFEDAECGDIARGEDGGRSVGRGAAARLSPL